MPIGVPLQANVDDLLMQYIVVNFIFLVFFMIAMYGVHRVNCYRIKRKQELKKDEKIE